MNEMGWGKEGMGRKGGAEREGNRKRIQGQRQRNEETEPKESASGWRMRMASIGPHIGIFGFQLADCLGRI